MTSQFKNLLTSTTLIPLWAKAVEAQKSDPILIDKYALSILRHFGFDLDYLNPKRQNPSQVGCCLRAKWMDDQALAFIHQNHPCNVIQLGAGLDDRFRRIGMPEGVANWYDLDLEEVAQMRREVIPEVERNEILSMDMFDCEWMEKLKKEELPVLLIVEGVTMFFPKDKIATLFHSISTHLGPCEMLLDAVPEFAVGRAKFHDSVQKYNNKVECVFGIKDGKQMEEFFPEVETIVFQMMSDLPQASKFMWLLRLAYKIPFFYKNLNQRLFKIRIR